MYRRDVLARVRYMKLEDQRIMLVEFVNFMGQDEIKRKYGEEVLLKYMAEFPYMVRATDGCIVLNYTPVNLNFLNEGLIVTKEAFSVIISSMKKCGERLMNLHREYSRKNRIREVMI
jgi:hypothetical protein